MRQSTKVLTVGLILLVVFSISFFFFYKRAQRNLPKPPLILTPAVINRPLPNTSLVNISGKHLEDEKLRRGKVVLVYTLIECEPCDKENEFLKGAIGNRKDLSVFYVIPFGDATSTLKSAQSKYAFETFFDEHSMLAKSLQIYRVPLKIFVEDGTIKKVWLEATIENGGQAEFKRWLDSL